jgi:hypothetical protein
MLGSNGMSIRSFDVKLGVLLYGRAIASGGYGNEILAVFKANDFSHSLGREQTSDLFRGVPAVGGQAAVATRATGRSQIGKD